jgi:hypothetical protein
MNRIVSPHQQSPKNKTQARLDHLQNILHGFQQSLIYKDQKDHLNNNFNLYILERIVETLAEGKLIKETPKEFFEKHSAAFEKAIKESRDKAEAEAAKKAAPDEINTNKDDVPAK